eukprot:Gb_15695 [translate_table: standard]
MFEPEFAVVFLRYTGGVLGTTEILFEFKKRGIGLSERLGMGFSCNGNNVAYVAGSSAPLKTYGLKKEDFSGVLPKAYPYMLFKGIGSYGWPQGPPQDPLLPRKIKEFKKLAKHLGGVLFMSRFQSTTIHLLGGCIATQNSSLGVAILLDKFSIPIFLLLILNLKILLSYLMLLL